MPYFDWRWFDKKWIHKDTGTKYDPNGFDRYWIHKDTWTKFAPSVKLETINIEMKHITF